MPNKQSIIGAYLNRVRKKKGITLKELAERTSPDEDKRLTERTVTRVIYELKNPTRDLKILGMICDVLGIELEYLLKEYDYLNEST